MGFDLISGFLAMAGIFLGLVLLFKQLLASRGMDVKCASLEESASRYK